MLIVFLFYACGVIGRGRYAILKRIPRRAQNVKALTGTNCEQKNIR